MRLSMFTRAARVARVARVASATSAASAARAARATSIPGRMIFGSGAVFAVALGYNHMTFVDAEAVSKLKARAPSERSLHVNRICDVLQAKFVERLSIIEGVGDNSAPLIEVHPSGSVANPGEALKCGVPPGFQIHEWLRDSGKHGGGMRYQADSSNKVFCQASINVSAVHYEDKARYPIDSATALSVILHPKNPYAPSMHFHISYIEPRKGCAYWRMIADLNPSIPNSDSTKQFSLALQNGTSNIVSKSLRRAAQQFGDDYFFIPALQRHRGAYHLFMGKLEEDSELSADSCEELAKRLACTAVDVYSELVEIALREHPDATLNENDYSKQLFYHTLYTFQVLTLDRGTTHGLLAHRDNDIGTLASLPPRVDPKLLSKWRDKMPPENKQRLMVDRMISAIPVTGEICDEVRQALANHVRAHYVAHPDAKSMQAELDLKKWMEDTRRRMQNLGSD